MRGGEAGRALSQPSSLVVRRPGKIAVQAGLVTQRPGGKVVAVPDVPLASPVQDSGSSPGKATAGSFSEAIFLGRVAMRFLIGFMAARKARRI